MCKDLLLILEVDGEIHETEENKNKDKRRERKLRAIGFTILRFKNWEVLYSPNDVYREIKEWVEEKMKST